MDASSPDDLETVAAALARDPRDAAALMAKARLLEAAGLARAAAQVYGAALSVIPTSDTGAEINHARQARQAYLDELEASLRAAAGASGPGVETFIERLVGKRRVYHQAPMRFHYPGLPELEFHDRRDFPWLEDLEAATGDIREELETILGEEADDLAPYVNFPQGAPLDQWAELNGSPRWGAFHLIFDGREIAWNAARAPKTMAMLGRLPQPRVPGSSPSALFSVLAPNTHIPPHTGAANTRLIVHLPLVVPEGCRFRVGSETRAWREGEAWVFDDTIEHEAWNDSDELRAILIFDVWNPRLSEAERGAITAVMAAVGSFSAG